MAKKTATELSSLKKKGLKVGMRVYNAKQKGWAGKITAIEYPAGEEGGKSPMVVYKSANGKLLRSRPTLLRQAPEDKAAAA